jgi:hypothetical protein
MDKFKFIDLINHITFTLDNVMKECRQLDDKYMPTVRHFDVGEKVYYINCHGHIVSAIIDEIQDFSSTTGPGGFVYYWIVPEGCKLTLFHKIKFWLSFHIKFIHLKYEVPDCFPGHGVLPGDDIFKTEQDAQKSLLLHNLKFNLIDYLTLLRKEEEFNEN